MSRILLVDHSPHAQRIGERILSDEGYEVVAVSNADSALIRLEDVDPDVVIADVAMPGRTGYELCEYLKMNPRHRHVRTILTAGSLEPFDEEQVQRSGAGASLKKPFEASALLAAVKPLAEAAANERAHAGPQRHGESGAAASASSAPFVAVVDAEQVRAAVTIALDAAMDTMANEIAGRVLTALRTPRPAPAAAPQPETPPPPESSEPPAAVPPVENVRRVTPLRFRSGSLLGLNLDYPEQEAPGPHPEERKP